MGKGQEKGGPLLRDALFPPMAGLPALASRLRGQIAIARETAILVGDVLAAFASSFSGQSTVLAETPLLLRNGLSAS